MQWFWEAYYLDPDTNELHILTGNVGHKTMKQAQEAFTDMVNIGAFDKEIPECAELQDVIVALK